MDHRAEYVARINRVIDHIEAHLHEDLHLQRLAKVACFSPYHFHRIFRAMLGETLQRFIQRLRLERAATQLLHNPTRTVTEIALDNGFSSPATFARAFRSEFEMSASDYRKAGKPHSNLRKADRNAGKDEGSSSSYVAAERSSTMTNELKMQVDVKELDPARVAYLRHVGPYQGDAELFGRLFGKLATWAGPRGLFGPATQFMSVYHDNPDVTDDSKLRTSICLTIGDDVEVDGEIGAMTVPGGKYAIGRFRLDPDQYAAAWDALMAQWLPDSGYQPDDRVCFERYLNDPEKDPEHKHDVEICVPVRPL